MGEKNFFQKISIFFYGEKIAKTRPIPIDRVS